MLETGRVLKAMCVATAFGRDNCKILKLNFVGFKRFPAMFNSVLRKQQRKLSM